MKEIKTCIQKGQRYIIKNNVSVFKLALPLFNSLWGWSYTFNKIISEVNIIITGLLFALLIDLIFQKKLLNKWFVNLRIYVTTLAIMSFVI